MDTQGHTVAHFVVLFTSQKQKKYKTWQDGTMKYYSFNKKLVLIDEKGYNIDKKFSKTGQPAEGDEIEFDGHLVTVESFQGHEPYVTVHQPAATMAAPPPTPLPEVAPQQQAPVAIPESREGLLNYRQARKRPRVMGIQSDSRSVGSSSTANSVQSRPVTMQQSASLPGNGQGHHQSLYHQGVSTTNTDTSALTMELDTTTMVTNGRQQQDEHISRDTLQQQHASEHAGSTLLRNNTAIGQKEPPNLLHAISKAMKIGNHDSGGGLAGASNVNQMMDMDIDKDLLYLRRSVDKHPADPAGAGESSTSRNSSNNQQHAEPTASKFSMPLQKRVRVGLSKRTNSTLHASAIMNNNTANASTNTTVTTHIAEAASSETATIPKTGSFVRASTVNDPAETSTIDSSTSKPSTSSSSSSRLSKTFKVPLADGVSVPLVLQFPTMEKAMSALKSKRYPKRTRTVPSSFPNVSQYKDVFRRVIHEHLQILLLNYSIYYYSLYKAFGQRSDAERNFRSKGVGFYSSCHLQSDPTFRAQPRLRLKISNREHHSKYNKDDVWVISSSMRFDAASTFLGRSTYYGPSSDGYVELECVTSRDDRVATKLASEHASLYALRTISASSEFMMLDALSDNLDRVPLLPYVLSKGKNKKRKTTQVLPLQTPAFIHITRKDNLNVEQKIQDTVRAYGLNEDQEKVLWQVARSLIVAPGWNTEPADPIILVHGVFGSGKSYLAAVIIIFIRDVIETANFHREPDELIDFKIMISSMTNVAVDRILQSLMKLGYDRFVRVGSLKKIAKNILPYTAQAKLSSNEELKELEQMLDDPQNSEEDVENIATTIQRFRKNENAMQVQTADVVGTTCMATAFEIFSASTFPLVLLDESSQLTEPLTMVPLVRFQSSRLIMIGDPLQLPPTLTTSSDEDKVGQGLDKTLFDRLTEMGHESIMLRTQYRCHPDISAISNRLFYAQRLLNGVSPTDRKPLVSGLPTLLFVDVNGQEQRHPRSNSYWNEVEVGVAAHIIESLLQLKVPSSEIGIITLYKEQADRLTEYLGSCSSKNDKGVQISTVDAFQGGEKEVIILSTVRTTSNGFMDNNARTNVALTRAKRHLFILGKQELLINNHLWCNIINHCQDNSYTANDLARMMAGLKPMD